MVKEELIKPFRDEIELKEGDWIPNKGMQESVLRCNAQIILCGGNRGGGKSQVLLFDSCYDTHNPNFSGIFLRKETKQLSKGGGLFDKASKIFNLLHGKENKSNMNYTFPSGAKLEFDHIVNESKTEVEKRFKGLGIPAMYIDELDQFSFDTFLILMGSNRNSYGIRNRIIGTCNPNPDSWLRTLLDWYIDDEGFIIPERDRKIRYLYIYGQTVNDIIWGNTKEEVYEKASHYIDSALTPNLVEVGITYEDFIKSFAFIKGDLSENPQLLESDTNYLANIATGGAAAIARNLSGNWNIKVEGQEMVTRSIMDKMFNEDRVSLRSGKRYMSIDVALLGIDNFVMVIWDGLHIEDVLVKKEITSSEAYNIVKGVMVEYGIREENVVYDYTGNGQALNDMRSAYPVKPQQPPVGKEDNYDNIKSQIMYNFGRMLIEEQITCSVKVANKLYDYGKGNKKERMTFQEIMQNERRALMIGESTGRTRMLNKKEMKKILGCSPDFLEAVAYRVVFELDKKKKSGFRGLEWL
jgi:hypothetical protein